MLLETGNWSDCGHPTGRIVSFVNSFAMEKHFFNFSSSGQWMWDELRLTVPPGQDPFPLIDAIRRRVEQETGANASLAEAEWRKATKPRRADDFSARPVINVEPSASGVEIRIRYITRAYERHDTRSVLNQALVELLRGRDGTP
jgi:small-conductance mechanosensitive channel